MSAHPFNFAPDDTGFCNGDYIVRDARGRLIALIYRGIGKHGEEVARQRAEEFCRATKATWCSTCGEDTPNEEECATCRKWWADNPPPASHPSQITGEQ